MPHTVEARILELQEKKRQLAAQAIEAGGKKGAATKLSMKDILNLFRRDAEHDYRHDEHGYEGMSKLKEGRLLGGNGVGRGVEEIGMGQDIGGTAMRLTPPVVERGGKVRKEEGIYGRKWTRD